MTLIVHTESRQTSLLPAFRRVVPIFGTAMVFSFFINVLMFVSPLYMLQIYDRVVTSRSEATLFALTVLAGVLMVVYALLEGLRSRLLVRAGLIYDKTIAGDVFEAVHRANLRSPSKHVQCLRDVDVLREFLTGSGLIALCDFPWFPIFVAVSFILHPWFGYISLVGSAITLGLTILTELVTRKQLGLANRASGRAIQGAQAVFRNTEVIQALGMIKPVKRLWMKEHDEVLGCQAIASDRAGILMTLTKFSRFFLQIVILGTGAYLVIHQELTAGAIVAASILIGRALQPIEMAVANWKGFIAARGSYGRIAALFQQSGSIPVRLPLPRPSGAISAQGLICGAPGTPHVPILKGLAFELGAGEALGIVGPSAAGKSSLARVLVGVWPLLRGTIRLDGHELSHWDPENLGQWVGYLPQDVELFTGTVAENIARFQDCDANEIIEAADLAGSHELIQLLPDGYNSQIGENGCALSGGQRQRIGLARAMFRKPPLIVLDEPNASLDAAGEEALMRAMQRLRLAGSTIVIVTHKVNILAFTDKILVIADGLAQAFGPRDTIMQQIVGPRIVPAPSRPVIEEAAEGTGT